MTLKLDSPLAVALGGKSAGALRKTFGLETVGELLRHYPRRYAQRGELTAISGLELGEHATVLAQVTRVNQRRMQRRRGTITEVTVTDGHRSLELVFFRHVADMKKLQPGALGLFAGKIGYYQKKLQLAHPDFQLLDATDSEQQAAAEFADTLIPVYPASKDLPSWSIAKCVAQILEMWDGAPEVLPEKLLERKDLPGLTSSLRAIHQPKSMAEVEAARDRLKWDEALAVQLALAQRRAAVHKRPAPACAPREDGIAAAFDKRLPFELTAGQREVGEHIAADLSDVHPMNRLLQGEVGSGKTIVALRGMLQVVDAGRQAALLAPTEVLAAQHARSLRAMLGELAMAGELGGAEEATRITLLTGSLPAAQRKQAMLDAASGAAGIIVGTHALIQEKVSFADLGFVVVDEQHRFGVEQRDALRARAGEQISPHVLVMTATPIPRTVAMTVYGDLETSTMRELPRGRSPISTSVVPTAEKPAWLERAWQRIREEVESGHQAYIVCPRIGEQAAAGEDVDEPSTEDNEEDPFARRPPLAVLDIAPMLEQGSLSGLRIGVLHGRLPADEKDAVMRSFAAGELDVLVATTVIEVGVDVPNATVMAVLDAERFGVSQLHQLRGRVGRGSAPGLCLLMTEIPAGTSTRDRLDAVASTVDGFELARVDLEMRREGDILGATQSGRESGLKLLSLLRDEELIAEARTEAAALVEDDPSLKEHAGLATLVANLVNDDRAEYLEKA